MTSVQLFHYFSPFNPFPESADTEKLEQQVFMNTEADLNPRPVEDLPTVLTTTLTMQP